MKVLLLGKDGQVGEALQTALAPLGDVVALGRVDADFEQPGELPRIVATYAPDAIVNAAAYTAVDKAEAEPARARLVNAEAVALLADAAKRQNAWLVHYSTDYVFDGSKDGAYTETDEARPLGVYGATKLKGDEAIAAAGGKYLIFRVCWVYAPGHASFPASMLRLARDRESLNVVADQVGAPTSAALIAAVTAAALRRVATEPDAESLSGVYNLAAAGEVSRHRLAQFVVAEALARGAKLALTPEAIKAVSTAEFPLPAARPLNSRLDTSKLRRTFGLTLPPWEDDMRAWVGATIGGNP